MGDDPHSGDPLSRGSVTRQGTEGRTRVSQTAHHWVGGGIRDCVAQSRHVPHNAGLCVFADTHGTLGAGLRVTTPHTHVHVRRPLAPGLQGTRSGTTRG